MSGADYLPGLLWNLSVRELAGRLLIAALIGAAVGLALLGLNRGSLHRPGADRIAQAFADGSLGKTFDDGNYSRGLHQFNDCLILGLATDQRGTTSELTVSPTTPFRGFSDPCAALRTGNKGPVLFYHNYLHGHTTLARYLLQWFDVSQIRSLYETMIDTLLLVGVAIGLLRLREGKIEALPFLVVMISLTRFFGLEGFAQSLGHAPADIVFIGFVCSALLSTGARSTARACSAAALFGALTMVFEFLTGGLPLGLAAVIGLTWFTLQPTQQTIRNVLLAAACFGFAAIATLLTKIVAMMIVFGPASVASFEWAVSQRVSSSIGPEFAYHGLSSAIIGGIGVLASGGRVIATAFLTLGIAAGAWATYQRRDAPTLLLGFSNLVILAWFVIFRQHSITHAWFMDRILVWPLASGFGMFAWACSAIKSETLLKKDRAASS